MAGKFSRSIEPSELLELLQQGKAIHVVDVREHEEWAAGHIPGARHIPLSAITQRHSELDRQEQTILVCRSGSRSGLACELLEELGYPVVNMTGGMLQWNGNLE